MHTRLTEIELIARQRIAERVRVAGRTMPAYRPGSRRRTR